MPKTVSVIPGIVIALLGFVAIVVGLIIDQVMAMSFLGVTLIVVGSALWLRANAENEYRRRHPHSRK